MEASSANYANELTFDFDAIVWEHRADLLVLHIPVDEALTQHVRTNGEELVKEESILSWHALSEFVNDFDTFLLLLDLLLLLDPS